MWLRAASWQQMQGEGRKAQAAAAGRRTESCRSFQAPRRPRAPSDPAQTMDLAIQTGHQSVAARLVAFWEARDRYEVFPPNFATEISAARPRPLARQQPIDA